jgi:hypothetical protein
MTAAASADLVTVRQALGYDDSSAPTPLTGNHPRLLDAIANAATLRLGQGDPQWKPANPLWPSVYTRVRADLEPEAAQIEADLTAASQQVLDRLVSAVAAEVSQPDIDAILAYYGSAEGQRYQALMHQLDLLVAGGFLPPPGYDRKTAPPPLPEDQQKAILGMMMLSRQMQAASGASEVGAAMHADTSGLGGVAFMAAGALNFHQTAASSLYSQYAPDLAAFEAFERTAAAHSLFRALGRALFLSKPPPLGPSILDAAVKGAEQRHGRDWQSYYRAETGH